VSYLNSVPLVWGALNGPQRGAFDLSFAIPSICADRVAHGEADVGLVPVYEVGRLGLDYIPSLGVACHGPVRSILLIARVPFQQIRTLAVDVGSRTSVQLARIVLKRRYDVDPLLVPMRPDVTGMLETADAALVIGDAALSLDPSELGYACLDLGEEWVDLSELPMVFAVWAGHPGSLTREVEEDLVGSCLYGLGDLDRIIEEEGIRRGFPEYLVQQYLTRHIVFRLGPEDIAGLEEYLRQAALLDPERVLNVERAYDEAAGGR
jgi:predicted solute-binding protein